MAQGLAWILWVGKGSCGGYGALAGMMRWWSVASRVCYVVHHGRCEEEGEFHGFRARRMGSSGASWAARLF